MKKRAADVDADKARTFSKRTAMAEQTRKSITSALSATCGDAQRHAGSRADPAVRRRGDGAVRRLHVPGCHADYRKAFEAVICCSGISSGMPRCQTWWRLGRHTQAIGLNYSGCRESSSIPTCVSSTGSHPKRRRLMKREEYDELIEDPDPVPLRDLAATGHRRSERERPAGLLPPEYFVGERRHGHAGLLPRNWHPR